MKKGVAVLGEPPLAHFELNFSHPLIFLALVNHEFCHSLYAMLCPAPEQGLAVCDGGRRLVLPGSLHELGGDVAHEAARRRRQLPQVP